MEFRDCKVRLRGVTGPGECGGVVGQSDRNLSRAPAKLYLWCSSGAHKPDAANFYRHASGVTIARRSLWEFYQDFLSPSLIVQLISHYSFLDTSLSRFLSHPLFTRLISVDLIQSLDSPEWEARCQRRESIEGIFWRTTQIQNGLMRSLSNLPRGLHRTGTLSGSTKWDSLSHSTAIRLIRKGDGGMCPR